MRITLSPGSPKIKDPALVIRHADPAIHPGRRRRRRWLSIKHRCETSSKTSAKPVTTTGGSAPRRKSSSSPSGPAAKRTRNGAAEGRAINRRDECVARAKKKRRTTANFWVRRRGVEVTSFDGQTKTKWERRPFLRRTFLNSNRGKRSQRLAGIFKLCYKRYSVRKLFFFEMSTWVHAM